jgi:hypothetical protein
MPVQSLADILRAVERGVFPPADPAITVVPPPSNRESCVIAFTAHIVIAADVDAAWVAERIPPGDLAAPTSPPFLTALEQATGRRVSSLDVMLLAPALTDPSDRTAATTGLTELTDLARHPRVERALQFRDDVHVYGAHPSATSSPNSSTHDGNGPDSGIVVIGRGLASSRRPPGLSFQQANTSGRRSPQATPLRCARSSPRGTNPSDLKPR